MMKKKTSYRESRNQSINQNIENLKKTGIRFHYDRSQRQSCPPYSDDLHQNSKKMVRIAVILAMSSGLVAWFFYKIFKSIS